MMLSFCTLFDENYIDKGLVLYKSLERVCKDRFRLYILCMSDSCYEILTDLNWENIQPIQLSKFENEDLLRVKPFRTKGEYCWTCDSSLLKYVIENFQPEYCTYIDADMAFYDDPRVIIDEMVRRNASVSIVGHRFDIEVASERIHIYGKYCVECNTFKNDEKGNYLLNLWVSQCLEYCSADGDGVHYADQKYMDNWVDDYPFVIELDNLGAGIAKWNLSQYKLISANGDDIRLKCGDNTCRLLFFHFQGIKFLSENKARINVFTGIGNYQKKLVLLIYDKYLSEIGQMRKMLKSKYCIEALYKTHPGYKDDRTFFEKLIVAAQNAWRMKEKYFKRRYDFRKL